MPRSKPLAERLDAMTNKLPGPDGCWEWTGCSKQGTKGGGWYGHIKIGVDHPQWMQYEAHQTIGAHRISWMLHHGRNIPEGMEIDHLCRNTKCIRPDHLEVVDGVTNWARGKSPSRINSKKVYCKRGHLLIGDNLALYDSPDGGGVRRKCRKCSDMTSKAYRGRAVKSEVRRVPTFEELDRLVKGGIPWDEIGAVFGMSGVGVRNHAKRMGLPVDRRPRKPKGRSR